MSGENSKKSGEIGEILASSLLAMIGWKPLMHNVSIGCNNTSHVNEGGRPRISHGEDQIFIYHTPFHDDNTCIVHISDKNVAKYPSSGTLKSKFKSHLNDLHETIECAKFSPKINELCKSFGSRKTRTHAGLLIWLHNDDQDIEKNIKKELSNTRLETEDNEPIFLIDNERASFLLKLVMDLKNRGKIFKFHYPGIGTSIMPDEERFGEFLPLELVAADIIPVIVQNGNAQEYILYANQPYSPETYKRLIAYSLAFSGGLLPNIHIGMTNYNPALHKEEADQVRMAFHDRQQSISPFSFTPSILSLITERRNGTTL